MSLYDTFKAGPTPSPGVPSSAPVKKGIVGTVKEFFNLENDNPTPVPAPSKATGSLYEQFKGSTASPVVPASSVAPAPVQSVPATPLKPGIQPLPGSFATTETFVPAKTEGAPTAPTLTKNRAVAAVTGGTTLSQFVKDVAGSFPDASQKVTGWLENTLIDKPAEALSKTKFIQEAAAGIDAQAAEGKKNLGIQVLHKLQYGQEAISGLTGGIITLKTEAPEDISDKIASGLASALGTIVSIRSIGAGLSSISSGGKILETLQKYPLVYKYGLPFVKNAAAFDIYGQLDPALAGDVSARAQKMGKDFLLAAPFTALGYVNKAAISIPASFALGWGMAKLEGASNEDAFVSGVVLGGLDGAGRLGGSGRAFVTGRYADRALKNEAADVLNRYNDGKPLTPRSSPAEFERVWRKAAFQTHPDLGGDAKSFVAANAAYKFLTGKSDTFINTQGEPVQKSKTGETKLLEAADKVRVEIQSSEAFDVKRAVSSGDVQKDVVFKDEAKGILQPEFAQGRIEDVANKLNRYQPGLGDQFRSSVDVNNATMEGIIKAGDTALDIAVQTRVPGYSDPNTYLPRAVSQAPATPSTASPVPAPEAKPVETTPTSTPAPTSQEGAVLPVSEAVKPAKTPETPVAPVQGSETPAAVPQAKPIPTTPDDAAKTYYDEVLKPALDSGKAIVIGADDLKDFFGKDYNRENHSTYSAAANKLFERMLEETKNPTVKFTVGGTGAGKSDFLVKNEASEFNGIIYDSTGWNYEGLKKQIEAAQLAGKQVEVYGIVPDIARSRAYTYLREIRGEHPVTEKAFINTHVGAIETMQKLIKDGVDMWVLDTRDITTPAQVANAAYEHNPLALLEGLGYTQEYVSNTIKGIDASKAQAIISGGEESARRVFEENRAVEDEQVVSEEIAKETSGNIAARGGTRKTNVEKVKEATSEDAKTIKQIAEETGVLEPSVRRILGQGAKKGVFERVEKGVYVLSEGGKDRVFIHTADAIETLPKLADEGFKTDMVFLDIPYNTKAVKGGSRGVKYDLISVDDFKKVADALTRIVRDDNTPVYYMYSQAESGLAEMLRYNDALVQAGFKPIARGEYTKLFKTGQPVTNVRGVQARPEGILLLNKSGTFSEKDAERNLDFRLLRPPGATQGGYSTEKSADLLKALILQGTSKGDTVLDPFAGSGVTGAEAIKAGRNAVLIEKNADVVERFTKPRVKEALAGQESEPLKLVSMLTFDGVKTAAESKLTSPKYRLEEGSFERNGETFKYSIIGGDIGTTPRYTNSLEELSKLAKVDKTNTLLGKQGLITLHKTTPAFAERPVLVVESRRGNKFLSWKDEKTKFTIRASALGLKEENLNVGDLIEVDPANLKNTAKEIRVTQGGRAYASMDKFVEQTNPAIEAKIESVKRIEFPELVQLAKDLTGDYPSIVLPRPRPSMGGARPNGLFIPSGDGKVILNPELFKKGNEQQVAKTLAHEIGHLIDYLPNKTLSRGNLLGRLATLKNFRKDFYEAAGASRTNNAITRELYEFTKFWRPFETEDALPAYVAYRKDPAEMYADFISGLFNDPAKVAEMAPESYNTFFRLLDRKPQVAESYFDLQTLLKDGPTALKNRKNKVQNMFSDADMKATERQRLAELEADVKKKSLWFRFKWDFVNRGEAVMEMVEKAKKEGRPVNDDDNPTYYLEESNYLGGKIKAVVDEKFNSIYQELQKNDLTWEDLGELLFYERILKGDRGEVANPEGLQADFVRDLYDDLGTVGVQGDSKAQVSMRSQLGEEKFAALQDMAVRYRKAIKDVFVEGYNEGLYSSDLLDLINSNDFYVPFKPIKYAGEKTRFSVKKQKGTLQPIENPANTGIEKTVAVIRAIERNKVKRSIIKFVQTNSPADIENAKTMFNGKAEIPLDPRDEGMKLMTYMEDGKVRGFYVDEYIGESVSRSSVGHNNIALEGLRFFNGGLFRPLFITFNVGFQSYNLLRDFQRFWKNVPDATLASTFSRYLKPEVLTAARVRAFGLPEDASERLKKGAELINRMEKEQILSLTYNDILKGSDPEEKQIEKILRDLDVMERPDRKWEKIPVIREAVKVLEFVEKLGNFIETLPKVAGFVELEGKMPPRELGSFIRKYIGSPDFLAGGRLKPYTNEIFLFSNAIAQGIRSDWDIAVKNPKTRSGWWWKTAKVNIVPKLLIAMGVAGLFGDRIKEMLENISEYDKTNYNIIPLGLDQNGKTMYVRLPQDESGRLVGGLIWKSINLAKGKTDPFNDFLQIVSYTGGQLPSLSPVLGALSATSQFVSGQNPYDYFRGRNVLTDQEYQAGGAQAGQKFAFWMFEELGGGIFVKPYSNSLTPPKDTTTTERVLSLPVVANIFNRFLKVSNYGQTELIKGVLNEQKTTEARTQLARTDVVEKYVEQAFDKTPAQRHQLALQMVEEALGHKPSNPEERKVSNTLTDKFEKMVLRGKSDPRVNALLSATSNDQKAALIAVYQEQMDPKEFADLKTFIIRNRVASPAVFTKVRNQQQ